jgi:ubiquinone/menaquinone biosynthesis C-methylase UbiE
VLNMSRANIKFEELFTEKIERKIKRIDKEGFYGTPLRFQINRNLKKWISRYCPENNAEILEVGCGEGTTVKIFQEIGIKGKYLGIDIKGSPNWANINNTGQLKVGFMLQDAHSLSLIKNRYNFCISITAFEHFSDDSKVLNELSKVLLNDAVAILIIPSKYSYWLYGKHGYRRYSKKSIAKLAKSHGFQVIEIIKLAGAVGFLTHFFWSFISRILRLSGKCIYYMKIIRTPGFYYKVDNIMHIHLNYTFGKRVHRALQSLANNLDKKFTFFEIGYCTVLKKNKH